MTVAEVGVPDVDLRPAAQGPIDGLDCIADLLDSYPWDRPRRR